MRRIAFYSYDEHGLGHVRRSIAVAHALSAADPASILLIAGAREAALFRLPEGTDTLALPSPSTDFNGDRRGPAVGLDAAGTVRMRARTLRNALAGELSAAAVSTWLAAGGPVRCAPRAPIDMGGLRRVPRLLDELLAAPPRPFADSSARTPTRRFTRTAPAPSTNTGSVSA
jgi:hypothetical protein